MTNKGSTGYQSWKIEVEKVDNGYLVKEFFNYQLESMNVIEDKELKSDDFEQYTMRDMLNEVKDRFGVFYSKHNEKNCIISIEDKHHSPPKNI